MTVPKLAICIQLMDEYEMLTNIRHHSLVVAKVADALLTGLADESGRAPLADEKLVIAGALLHDIAKTPCLDNGCDHAALGAEICLRHGYPEVAQIVKEHVILGEHDPARYKNGLFTAGEIVYYADKRVRHAEIVSLEERLQYIISHYGNNDPHRHALIRENFERCREMEQALFSILPFSVNDLEAQVRFPVPPVGKEYDPWS